VVSAIIITVLVFVDGPTGCARFEASYKPDKEFLELLVRTCLARKLKGLDEKTLASTIKGEGGGCSDGQNTQLGPYEDCVLVFEQAWSGSTITREPSSWSSL
jgi:hypothetical protein